MITEAFAVAAEARAKVLGMPEHPIVVAPHPLASRTQPEVRAMAERLVDQIAAALVRRP